VDVPLAGGGVDGDNGQIGLLNVREKGHRPGAVR
jgi:hypothetical protein